MNHDGLNNLGRRLQKKHSCRVILKLVQWFLTRRFLKFILRRCPSVSLTLCCFVVYSTRRFVVCLSMCHFVLVFFSPFSIAITSLGEERANLSAFRTFVRFVLIWICRFPLPLGVWEGLRFVIVALPGLFSYLFFSIYIYRENKPRPMAAMFF